LANLEFPDNGKVLPEAVFVKGLQLDNVGELGRGVVGRATRQTLWLDIGHSPRRTTNLDDLPGLG
jgi:hypothetical protein